MLINWKIVSHPMNWATILLMVIIAGAFGHMVLEYLGHTPETAETSRRSSYDAMPAGQSPGQTATDAIDPQGSLQT